MKPTNKNKHLPDVQTHADVHKSRPSVDSIGYGVDSARSSKYVQ